MRSKRPGAQPSHPQTAIQRQEEQHKPRSPPNARQGAANRPNLTAGLKTAFALVKALQVLRYDPYKLSQLLQERVWRQTLWFVKFVIGSGHAGSIVTGRQDRLRTVLFSLYLGAPASVIF